jgi:thiamine pyrophosphokinase
MNPNKAFLFVNGEVRNMACLRAQIHEGDMLVAVDGGLNHLLEMGLTAQFLIGDLDSITREQEEQAIAAGSQVIRFPPEKDETDLELALDFVVKRGCDEICVAGGLGGRLDQTLGNIYLLTRPNLEQCDIRIDDGVDEVIILRNEVEINGSEDDIVSLLPISEQVRGVRTEKLKYPLTAETLYRDHTRGISNVMESNLARVRIESGILLCIHSRVGLLKGISGGYYGK